MTVTGTTDFPTGYASLSDGTTTIEFIFTDGEGERNELAFKADPYPRLALKMTSEESKYSDLEPPYFAIAQDDFTGGRGNEDFEADTSRYYDGHWLDTSKESGVILGGRETYSTGYRNMDQTMPGSMTFQGVYNAPRRYLGVTFEASASYTTYQCEIWVKKIGTHSYDLQVELWSDSGSAPNAMLASKTITAANITSDTVSLLVDFVWTGSPGITSGTDYWVVIDGGDSATSTAHWAIGCDAATAGQKKATAGGWSATTYSPYFRITPAKTIPHYKYFEYNGGFYAAEVQQSGNSELYILGDRGVADSSAANTLVDGTKSWTTNEFANSIVVIVAGIGVDQVQPWRTISSNNGTTLTVSENWDITPNTNSEYVIINTNKWRNVKTLNVAVNDVAVVGRFVYFTSNDNAETVDRMIEYNDGGTFTRQVTSDVPAFGKKLLGLDQDEDKFLFFSVPHSKVTTAERKSGSRIYKSYVPEYYHADADLFYPMGELVDTTRPWDALNTTNVTVIGHGKYTGITVAEGFTTGTAAVRNLDTPVDITAARQIKATVYSSVATNSGDIQLVYDDVEDLGQTRSPVKVLQAKYTRSRSPTKVFHWDDPDGTEVFTDLTRTYDGLIGDGDTVSITTDDYLAIGHSSPFNKIYVTTGTTPNDEASVMTAAYGNGKTYTAVTITDGTKTNGDTLKQANGTITFTDQDDWVATTINSVEAYWILLDFDANLTASININNIYVIDDDTLEGAVYFRDLNAVYAGDANAREMTTIETSDYIYVGHGTKFNIITVDMGGTTNDVASVMTAQYFDGDSWASVAIVDGTNPSSPSDGDTLKEDGDITFTIPEDWETTTVNSVETYWIRLDVSVQTTADILINEITVTRQNNVTVDIPALEAAEWHTCVMSLSTNPYPAAIAPPDESAIASVGLSVAVDNGIQTVFLKDIQIGGSPNNMEHLSAKDLLDETINGLEVYSGNVDDPVKNPWIMTDKTVYEYRTQEDDELVPLPLGELTTLASPENGVGHCVNGTYLFFNLGQKIQRYFNRTLDDVGPDRDEGLPSGRQGIPRSMVSYAGAVYAGIDGGASGTSSVLALHGTSWHEVYRAPQSGERIRSIGIQAMPGTNVDRLWISMGSDVLWVPISLTPYNDSDFTFTHEGSLTTSYIYANLIDVVKLWKSLKIFVENVTATRNIVADYQVDGDTTWTEIGTFDTVPVEEIDIASTLPQAKRIRYRLRFFTADQTESPRMKAIVTEGVAGVPVKTQYAWTFKLTQDTDNIDLRGKYVDTLTTLQQYNQALSWANTLQPLTLRHHSALYDNKTVFLNPASVSPLTIVDAGPEGSQERHIASITCIEA